MPRFVEFSKIKVGDYFWFGGRRWKKLNTQKISGVSVNAHLVDNPDYYDFFNKNDLVEPV